MASNPATPNPLCIPSLIYLFGIEVPSTEKKKSFDNANNQENHNGNLGKFNVCLYCIKMHRGIYFGCLSQEKTFKRKCAGEQFIFIVKHLIVSTNALWITSFGKKQTNNIPNLYMNKCRLFNLQINNKRYLMRIKRCTNYPINQYYILSVWPALGSSPCLHQPITDWATMLLYPIYFYVLPLC